MFSSSASMMTRNDFGSLYAKSMKYLGCGTAMFQQVSARDMMPPCIGYVDGNGAWNLIANLEWSKNGETYDPADNSITNRNTYKPLEREPRKMKELMVEWRPRTSIGVRQSNFDASGTGLLNVADAHIKYKSSADFSAVLMARKPVTLISYNDETLFRSWLAANKAQLSSQCGTELRRYGLQIITRIYTSPGCSINAWGSKDEEVDLSMKAKASMLGEEGEDVEWTQRLIDKNWSHYRGKHEGDTVVLFFDGIEVPAFEWWRQSIRRRIGRAKNGEESRCGSPVRAPRALRRQSTLRSPRDMTRDQPSEEQDLQLEDLWGSSTPLHKPSTPISRNVSRGQQMPSRRIESLTRSMSTPKRLSRYLDYDQRSPPRESLAVHFSPHPSVRITAPKPSSLRHSRASTEGSFSSVKRKEPRATDTEMIPNLLNPKIAPRKRPDRPSLRHTT